MAIAINGSGTITGISAGGLPDNTVDGGNIAMGSDAAGDILYYNGTDYIRLAKGSAGQVLKMNSGATAPEWGSAGGGITVADQWRLDGSLTGSTSYTPTNWEQNDGTGFANIGTAMSHSSGIFTFPSTGIYRIVFTINIRLSNDLEAEALGKINVTTNNSSYTEVAVAESSIPNNSANAWCYMSATTSYLFDVTSTTNCKVKPTLHAMETGTYWNGYDTKNATHITFTRLGDT